MQDSILQNGFGESPAPPSTAQVDQVSGFTLSLADKIASQVNANKFSTDFKIAALQGVAPLDHINSLNAKAQELGQVNAKIDADIAATKASIAGLKPQEANDANYVSAINAYENLLKQSPNAPVLQKMNLTDTDKLMMGFALLSGVNPNDAIGNFIKVKQGFVDQANNQAVDQFKIDTGVFNQQLGGLENMITYQGQQLNREQSRLNKEYETQYNGFADQLSELYKRADNRGKAIIQHIGSLSDDFRQTWEKGSRAWSADDEKAAQEWLTQQAKFLDVDPAQLIASVPRPQIGDIPQKVVNENADNTREDLKIERLKTTQSWKNAKALFDMRLKQVNMIGQVTEADRKALLPLAQELFKESPESLLPQIGEDWKKIQGQQRLNKPTGAGSRGGRGRSGGGSPKPVEGSLNPSSDTVPFDPGAPNLTEKEIKSIRSQAYKIDQDIIGLRAEQQATEDKDERKKIESKIAGKRAQREALLKRVGMTADDLKALMEDINQAMSAFGFNASNAPAQAQNPQAQTNPAKSPQNAGKGQPGTGKTKKKADGITFNPNPR